MHQPYNRIRLSLSAVNRMKIKSLIRSRIITKCFTFYEKSIFLVLPICSGFPFYFQYFDCKCLISFDLNGR